MDGILSTWVKWQRELIRSRLYSAAVIGGIGKIIAHQAVGAISRIGKADG